MDIFKRNRNIAHEQLHQIGFQRLNGVDTLQQQGVHIALRVFQISDVELALVQRLALSQAFAEQLSVFFVQRDAGLVQIRAGVCSSARHSLPLLFAVAQGQCVE